MKKVEGKMVALHSGTKRIKHELCQMKNLKHIYMLVQAVEYV